jgi:hypothetical protein
MGQFIDLTGTRFGKLTVIKRSENVSGCNNSRWLCKCDCGKAVVVRSNNLHSGNTNSCGCFQKEQSSRAKKTHGETKTRLYRIWALMINRCKNPNAADRKNYSERGISICPEWNNYQMFKDWSTKNGYKDGITIDRIDNNGNYEPSNCRWTTPKVQQNNRRNNVRIEYDGNTHTLAEWAELYKIPYKTFWARINRGWDIGKALAIPSRGQIA